MKHKEKILSLRKEGKSYNQICKILGCSKSTVSYHLGPEQKQKTRLRSRELRKNFQEYLNRVKEESGCVDCKESFPYYILEFDHRNDEEKLGGITSVFRTYGLNIAIEEIKKCDVVCGNCHNKRTWERKPW